MKETELCQAFIVKETQEVCLLVIVSLSALISVKTDSDHRFCGTASGGILLSTLTPLQHTVRQLMCITEYLYCVLFVRALQ